MRKLLLSVVLALGIAGLADTPASAWWGGRTVYYSYPAYGGYTYTPYVSGYYATPAYSYYGGPGLYYGSAYYSPYSYSVPYRAYYARPGVASPYYYPYSYGSYYTPSVAPYASGYWAP